MRMFLIEHSGELEKDKMVRNIIDFVSEHERKWQRLDWSIFHEREWEIIDAIRDQDHDKHD
eukprot:10448198-Heterocapsa_arctica.AAC.1